MSNAAAIAELYELVAPDPERASYFTFRPRPNDPARYDQQQAFVDYAGTGVAFLIGGNGAGTTECALYKLARFVFGTEPPRHNTPFWIIGDDFEQTMLSCWAEKLHGHGLIPRTEINWPKIQWHNEKANMPLRVPLREWPDRPDLAGRNWMIEFRSYEQGRRKMQSRSLGGFMFTEQFPWELLVEVERGMREYNFPGSKFCEFTPVDPRLTYRLEEMERDGRLPPGWEIFRANTEVALEHGHIQKTWYDEFYGMLSEEERETRKTGAWASYAGQVYKKFNPRVHVVDQIEICPGMHHRRAIDWGSGPENAFVCLWGARNGLGEWFIYDEYWSTDQNLDVLQHLAAIEARWDWPEWSDFHGTTWADPSSLDCIRLAMHHGFPGIMQGRNAVQEGIECVRRHLHITPGTGRPRLFIHRKCKNLVREMGTYHYPECTTENVNSRDPAFEPVKRDDHAVDALRYLLFSEEGYGGGQYGSRDKHIEKQRYGIQFKNGNGHKMPGGFR